ncbi:lamin tail domain-containing protein [Candidatus Bathyarchaeota archaeon]|nr:lamin tail domain-containing protein [Candidatus Bathyarchaeota archaeon]
MKGVNSHLIKSRLSLAVMVFTLLLSAIPLGGGQTSVPDGLVINEFMANNDEEVAGPDGGYPDWIELYNAGDESVDVAGMYLSDDLSDLKWQFPSGTVIEAGGFLVVWAGNYSKSVAYLNFNLNAKGEVICLLAEDAETLIDSIPFAQQFNDISYGRQPDGGSTWNYLTPTPSLSNTLGTPVTPEDPKASIPTDLFINEFMAKNDDAVAGPDGDYPDWIELYNDGTEAVDLSGMYLTDDLSDLKWQFPSGTTIESDSFLVVWADNTLYSGSLHTSFGLNATGEEIGLFAEDEETLIDSIRFGAQDSDASFGRFPDGSPSWNQLTPTPGVPNESYESEISGIPNDLVINEFMANNDIAIPGPDCFYSDWIELYNGGSVSVDVSGMYLSDNLANPCAWQFPSGTFIAPNGFLVVWADNVSSLDSLHASFALNSNGEEIGLFACDGKSVIDAIVFDNQVNDVSYGRLPNGNLSWNYLTPTLGLENNQGKVVNVEVATPFGSVPDGLFINELMADNQITIADSDGTYPDWIELYNASNETIDLGGMYLTDDLADPTAWRFPNDTLIESGGYLLIWAGGSSDNSSLHTSFGLNANGEAVGLFASDGVKLIDSVTFVKQLGDVSYGRMPDGGENWDYLLKATPGWGNDKRQPGSDTSVWLVVLLIGTIIGLSAIVVVAGKIYTRRKR